MRRGSSFLALAAALLALPTACAGGATLTVVVRTDFAPTTEFATVTVMVEGTPRVRAAGSGDDWFHGVQVASFGGLTVGSHDVRASLLDASGRTVASRHVILTMSGDYTLTVELTRGCAALHCPESGDPPGATECLGSRCVDPHCGGTDVAACPPAECTTAATCPAPAAACATASCDHGVCLYSADDTRCPASEPLCDLARGCVSMIEPLDGGALDLGPPDLGPPDLGPRDLGPPDLGPDAGRPCSVPADCADDDSCTSDFCFSSWCVRTSVRDGTACDAGAYCFFFGTSPSCMAGTCVPPSGAMNCDDHNPCTDDRCGGLPGSCRHSNVSGSCPYGDGGCGFCSGGTCLPLGTGC